MKNQHKNSQFNLMMPWIYSSARINNLDDLFLLTHCVKTSYFNKPPHRIKVGFIKGLL